MDKYLEQLFLYIQTVDDELLLSEEWKRRIMQSITDYNRKHNTHFEHDETFIKYVLWYSERRYHIHT